MSAPLPWSCRSGGGTSFVKAHRSSRCALPRQLAEEPFRGRPSPRACSCTRPSSAAEQPGSRTGTVVPTPPQADQNRVLRRSPVGKARRTSSRARRRWMRLAAWRGTYPPDPMLRVRAVTPGRDDPVDAFGLWPSSGSRRYVSTCVRRHVRPALLTVVGTDSRKAVRPCGRTPIGADARRDAPSYRRTDIHASRRTSGGAEGFWVGRANG